jgi:hypothetical protein
MIIGRVYSSFRTSIKFANGYQNEVYSKLLICEYQTCTGHLTMYFVSIILKVSPPCYEQLNQLCHKNNLHFLHLLKRFDIFPNNFSVRFETISIC